MMRVLVVTPPPVLVSLATAKEHLRVDGGNEDALISAYIAAASAHIDGPAGWLGRAIGEQVIEIRGDYRCGTALRLPCPPALELVSISYLDAGEVEQMVDLADVELLGDELSAVGSAWPWIGGSSRREALRIRYRAGYETIPAPVVAAVLLMVGDLHSNRETAVTGTIAASVPMSTTVESLLGPYRVFR